MAGLGVEVPEDRMNREGEWSAASWNGLVQGVVVFNGSNPAKRDAVTSVGRIALCLTGAVVTVDPAWFAPPES